MVSGCKATVGCIAYVGISYLTQTLQAGLGYAQLRNAKNQYELPTSQAIAAEAAAFVSKTPANGTISLIYGPASGGYPIINYEYAIVSTHQSSSTTAKNVRSVLEWAINKKYGSNSYVPVPGRLPATPLKGAGTVDQASPEHLLGQVTAVGGVAGSVPATPHSESLGKPPLPKRAMSFARRNEEHAWRGSAWIAVILPLAALVFALTVLALKAWPAIRLNGWYFLYGRTWTYGSGYASVVHTNGIAHLQGEKFGAWAILWGTLVSSLIAIVIAVPLSLGAAFALTERMPKWISRPLGFTVEILAGIPSVVIGLWGILTFGPWLAKHVYPVIANNMPDVPVLQAISGAPWAPVRACSRPASCSR